MQSTQDLGHGNQCRGGVMKMEDIVPEAERGLKKRLEKREGQEGAPALVHTPSLTAITARSICDT